MGLHLVRSISKIFCSAVVDNLDKSHEAYWNIGFERIFDPLAYSERLHRHTHQDGSAQKHFSKWPSHCLHQWTVGNRCEAMRIKGSVSSSYLSGCVRVWVCACGLVFFIVFSFCLLNFPLFSCGFSLVSVKLSLWYKNRKSVWKNSSKKVFRLGLDKNVVASLTGDWFDWE